MYINLYWIQGLPCQGCTWKKQKRIGSQSIPSMNSGPGLYRSDSNILLLEAYKLHYKLHKGRETLSFHFYVLYAQCSVWHIGGRYVERMKFGKVSSRTCFDKKKRYSESQIIVECKSLIEELDTPQKCINHKGTQSPLPPSRHYPPSPKVSHPADL